MRFWLFVGAILALGCGSEEGAVETKETSAVEPLEIQEIDLASIDEEVAALVTDHSKIAFLRVVLTEDQRVRQEETAALEQYGYQSDQHRAATNEIVNLDALNLAKVNAFKEAYGMPGLNSVGRMQADATWSTVHHSPDLETRRDYFEFMRHTWQQELISGSMYTMYLQRWCEMETGDRVMMEGAYTDEEEIKALYEKLGISG